MKPKFTFGENWLRSLSTLTDDNLSEAPHAAAGDAARWAATSFCSGGDEPHGSIAHAQLAQTARHERDGEVGPSGNLPDQPAKSALLWDADFAVTIYAVWRVDVSFAWVVASLIAAA